ncbi:hypothetical protein E8L90_00440 [Brevibacillus antibioticus]|uniref:DUF2187 domain-containing protein n=1 Tax=Brevibacillus antibioticus TaxID=2570228 RepID=A0A4U2Y4B0_9BACL|nr:hypothetical protein [Brevibacillus antibioticus]TKI54041.1 hypothetical protein E8L90_00440 [Brevibacillus antibioticus]
MNFVQKLRLSIGDNVQVVTGFDVTTGELVDVTNSTLTVLTPGEPGYGDKQVVFQINRITYARFYGRPARE